MKVELVQLAGRDGDTAYNLQRTIEAIGNCGADTDLLVFPETQLMGFPTEENINRIAEPLDGPSITAVQQAAQARNVAVVVGMAKLQTTVVSTTPPYWSRQKASPSPTARPTFGHRTAGFSPQATGLRQRCSKASVSAC